jgi:small subunit ribosomal protein S4e
MGGIFAPMPTAGAHQLRESIPLILLLRNRLKYALNGREVKEILMERYVKVDGMVRTNPKFPAGFNDVLSIQKTNDNFRLLYDTKGRFVLHPITKAEAKFKLCKVTLKGTATNGVPFITTNDGRTVRYPDPLVKTNDTIKYNFESGTITKFVHFATGNLCMITGGHNTGRIGEIIQRETHPGSFEIVHVRDIAGNTFTTRASNVFVIGQGHTSFISLPKGRGLKLSAVEDRKRKLQKQKQEKKAGKRAKKTKATAKVARR